MGPLHGARMEGQLPEASSVWHPQGQWSTAKYGLGAHKATAQRGESGKRICCGTSGWEWSRDRETEGGPGGGRTPQLCGFWGHVKRRGRPSFRLRELPYSRVRLSSRANSPEYFVECTPPAACLCPSSFYLVLHALGFILHSPVLSLASLLFAGGVFQNKGR